MKSTVKAYAAFSGISSFQVLAMFRRGLFYTFLSIYMREFLGLSVTETTLFATIPMVTSSLCQMFVWGSLSDRLQLRRTFIIVGEVLAAAGTLALWYVHLLPESKRASGYVIIVGLSIIEFFWSMSNVGWSALISDIYKPEERSTIQGQLMSIGAIGRIIGVYIGGTLYDGLGAHYKGWGFHEGTLFFAAAGAMLLSTVPMLFVPEGGIRRDEADRVDAIEEGGGPGRIFLVFLVAVALINVGRNSMAVLRAPFACLESGLAMTPQQLTWVTNIQSLAMIAMGPAVGIICLRLKDGRALLAGSGLAIVALFVFGFAPYFSVACFGNTLAGASESIIWASSYSLASVLIPAGRRGRYFGTFNATSFLSWGIGGTLIIGPLIDVLIYSGMTELAAYRMGFLAAMAITTVGSALLCYLIFIMMKQDKPDASAMRHYPRG